MEVLFVSVSLLDPFLQLFWGHQNFFTSLLQASLQPLWLMFNRRPTWLILVFVSLPVLWRNQKLKSKLKSNFTKNCLLRQKAQRILFGAARRVSCQRHYWWVHSGLLPWHWRSCLAHPGLSWLLPSWLTHQNQSWCWQNFPESLTSSLELGKRGSPERKRRFFPQLWQETLNHCFSGGHQLKSLQHFQNPPTHGSGMLPLQVCLWPQNCKHSLWAAIKCLKASLLLLWHCQGWVSQDWKSWNFWNFVPQLQSFQSFKGKLLTNWSWLPRKHDPLKFSHLYKTSAISMKWFTPALEMILTNILHWKLKYSRNLASIFPLPSYQSSI